MAAADHFRQIAQPAVGPLRIARAERKQYTSTQEYTGQFDSTSQDLQSSMSAETAYPRIQPYTIPTPLTPGLQNGSKANPKDAEPRRQHGPYPSEADDLYENEQSDRLQQMTYYPPPGSSTSRNAGLSPPAMGVSRIASTASVSTTKAARGSPPPPETPIDLPGDDIAARFMASGIAGEDTMNELEIQRLKAARAQQQAAAEAQRQEHIRATNGPASLYQQQRSGARSTTPNTRSGQSEPAAQAMQQVRSPNGVPGTLQGQRESALEEDMRRVQVSDEPPPAYATVPKPGFAPIEKHPINTQVAQVSRNIPTLIETAATPATAIRQEHPAFANDHVRADQRATDVASPTPLSNSQSSQNQPVKTPSPGPTQTSPPPLPEGWISHLDQGTGHYYYIHLPTQSTQWEFPKGPTPLNLNEPPLSPTGTLVNYSSLASPMSSHFFGNLGKAQPSPGFAPSQSGYAESIFSMQSLSSPTAAGFMGPPPSAGIDMYKIAPSNGVYFGPYLRYTNTDIDNGVWYGSIMLVTDAPNPPTIHIHQSTDLSPNRKPLRSVLDLADKYSAPARGPCDLQASEMAVLPL
ncbi:hypothetical protein MRB53_037664 [Persea americana]|nr:hypothetical protein MRB53_037664 [Persea americana]